MNTRERNQFISDLDRAVLETVRGFSYDDGESESCQLLELAYIKMSNALDTLKLPEGDQHG